MLGERHCDQSWSFSVMQLESKHPIHVHVVVILNMFRYYFLNTLFQSVTSMYLLANGT